MQVCACSVFRKREVAALLSGEIVGQVLLGIPLGLWVGEKLAAGMLAGIDPEVYRIPMVISRQTQIFAVSVALAVGAVSMLAVRRLLNKVDLLEALKTRGT